MKAIRYDRYGPPDVLELADVDLPEVGEDEMLVRVRAASVNPLDWHVMRGTPYLVRMMAGLSRPRASAARLGADMAGSVEAVGGNVTGFRPGDEVFGGLENRGTLAEYISIRQDAAVLAKPTVPSAAAARRSRRSVCNRAPVHTRNPSSPTRAAEPTALSPNPITRT